MIDLSQRDIGYRLWVTRDRGVYGQWNPATRNREISDQPHWFVHYGSYGGLRGVWDDVNGVKQSARSNGIKKGTYEIWKFHMGRPDSLVPWFPPEKVYG